MVKKKTVLFFPIEIGLAHITRSLAIAEELHSRGHKVIFALPKRKLHLVAKSPVTFVDIPPVMPSDSILDLGKFRDKQFVRNLVEQELPIIDKYKPDVIVVDYRMSALASAVATNTKAVFISHGNILPYDAHVPNPGFPLWLYNVVKPILAIGLTKAKTHYLKPLMEVAQEYGSKIKTLKEWYQKVVFILPEPKMYFPAEIDELDVRFTEPLHWKGFDNLKVPEFLYSIKPDGKTVYFSFGGTGFDPDKFVKIVKLLLENGYRVICTTSTIVQASKLTKHPNFFSAQFLPGEEVCERVDFVVCHGGYGTMIQAIQAGKPVLAIPFNPDQLSHALRMQELGIGLCLLKIKLSDIPWLLKFDWRIFEALGKSVDPKTVLDGLEKLKKNKFQFQKTIKSFQRNYSFVDGAKQAADIIEQL